MKNDYISDYDYLEHKFVDESFYDGCTGMPMTGIMEALKELSVQDKALPRPIAKARAFAYVLDNMQTRVSNFDYFPALAACPVKPLNQSYVSVWGKDVLDRFLTAEEADEAHACNVSRLARLWFDFEHCVPDWDAVLSMGFSGLLERAERYREAHQSEFATHPEAEDYFDSIRIEYQAILRLMDRLIG